MCVCVSVWMHCKDIQGVKFWCWYHWDLSSHNRCVLPAARCNEASAAFSMWRLGWGLSMPLRCHILGWHSSRWIRRKRRLATGIFPLKMGNPGGWHPWKGDSSPNWMSWFYVGHSDTSPFLRFRSSQLRFISSVKFGHFFIAKSEK